MRALPHTLANLSLYGDGAKCPLSTLDDDIPLNCDRVYEGMAGITCYHIINATRRANVRGLTSKGWLPMATDYRRMPNAGKRGTTEERFWRKVNKDGPIHPVLGTACWLWDGSIYDDGYGAADIDGRPARAHRLAWFLETGVMPYGRLVCHHCDTPACVRFDHLFVGNNTANLGDMADKLRSTHGEKNPAAKLTAAQVTSIRQERMVGAGRIELATKYGVTESAIYRIVARRGWKHVP